MDLHRQSIRKHEAGIRMGRPDRANPDPENDACRRPSQSQAPAMRRPARTAKPQGRIPEHEASFQTRGPIVRGDGANKNGEFQGRTKKSRTAGMGAPQCTLPGLWGRGWGAAHLRASGAGLRRAARPAVALEAWRAFSAPFRRRRGRAALARSPRGSVRSSALDARRSPSRTYRSFRAEPPARPYWHIGKQA